MQSYCSSSELSEVVDKRRKVIACRALCPASAPVIMAAAY